MDEHLFLSYLRDHSLEEGKTYLQEHLSDLEEIATVSNVIAEDALHQRDVSPFVALKLADLLIFLGDTIHQMLPRALGLKAKGDVLNYMEHHQSAIECLDAAGEAFLAIGDEVNWARTRIAWVISCAWTGRVEEGLQGAAAARAVFLRHEERYWACVIDHNTAVVYSQMGEYQKALELYERMLAIYPTLTDQDETFIKRAIALVEMNKGRNVAWLGNFEQAYQLEQKAQTRFVELGQIGLRLNTEFILAEFDYVQGYYGSALRRYYQLIDDIVLYAFDEPLVRAELSLQIAACLIKLNKIDEACHIGATVVELCRSYAVPLDLGNALREYANALIAANRLQEALAALEEAVTVFTKGGLQHHASITQLQQAELLLKRHASGEAYALAQQLKVYFDAQGLVARSVRAMLVMIAGLIEHARQAQGQDEDNYYLSLLREATSLCKQTNTLSHQHNLQEQTYQIHYLQGQLALLQGDVQRAIRHYRVAIARVERILSGLAYDLVPAFLYTTWKIYEDMIALYLQHGYYEQAFGYLEQARSLALRQHRNKLHTATIPAEKQGGRLESTPAREGNTVLLRIQRELRLWQEKYHSYNTLLATFENVADTGLNREQIQAEIKHCEEKLSELFDRVQLQQVDVQRDNGKHNKKHEYAVSVVSVEQLQQQLSPNHVLLAYFLYGKNIVIFALTAKKFVTYEIAAGVEQLERLLLTLHMHWQPSSWPSIHKPTQVAVRRLLHKLQQLLLAPIASLLPESAGTITVVPYGPLHKLPFHALHDGTHFLIEKYQVSYLPASSTLSLFDRKSVAQAQTDQVQKVRKLPLVLGYSEQGQLPIALAEAKDIAGLLDGRCYLEQEATIARLNAEASGSPIIHIATHGQSRMDKPNFSFVRLADGQLNAIDAFSLPLKGCQLVTLSGCETGLALSGGGDEQLGLGRAFLAAGADSLVMSLWTVEDSATNELMQRFYHHLLQGDTKIQALRKAQCHFIKLNDAPWSHPYFWAAFRLVGNTGQLYQSQQ